MVQSLHWIKPSAMNSLQGHEYELLANGNSWSNVLHNPEDDDDDAER